jgi:tetratricopeptide (TPR) repeat protein
MRSHTLIAVQAFCSFLGFYALPAGAADEFDNLLQKGRDAYEAADMATAAQFYEKACSAEALKGYPAARVAYCHHQLATVSSAMGRDSEAEQHYLRAIEAWRPAGNRYMTSWCVSLMNLGDLYRRQHRLPEAEERLQQAAGLARQFEQERPELAPETLSRLGVVYLEMSRLEPAASSFRAALTRFAALVTPAPAEEAYAWNGMGMMQLGSGQQAEAEGSLRRALSLATPVLGESHPETATYQTNLALALIVVGQFDRANTLLKRAKHVIETRSGASDSRLGLILAELSACASGEKKLGLAEEYAQQALAILNRQPEPNRTAIALARVNLADVYLKAHRLDDAEAILPGAIATERELAPDTRLLADGLRRLADLRNQQHAWQKAGELYREAIDIYERRLGANSPVLAPALRGYAEALRHFGGSKSEVRIAEARAKAVAGFAPRS